MRALGETLYLWRKRRGLTQAELARRTGVSRPNLSAIEQGRRDVTVSTVYRLAEALEVHSGALVDGIGPDGAPARPLSRAALDRIAAFAAGKGAARTKEEREIGMLLRPLIERKAGLGVCSSTLRRTAGAEAYAFSCLRARLTRSDMQNVLSRVNKHIEAAA